MWLATRWPRKNASTVPRVSPISTSLRTKVWDTLRPPSPRPEPATPTFPPCTRRLAARRGGNEELVTISELVGLIADVADKRFTRKHNLSKPQGVRGRNGDNTKLREVLGWVPRVRLREGLIPT